MVHDERAILAAILAGYALPATCQHGVIHWARVLENGLAVAEHNGADREVVRLFALFHDARRVNEWHDPGHGQRGGELARSLRGSLVELDDARFELLYEACRLHTDGFTEAEPTLTPSTAARRAGPRRRGGLLGPRKPVICNLDNASTCERPCFDRSISSSSCGLRSSAAP